MSDKPCLDERHAVSACVICGHRAVWHHDERGCQYHGSGPSRCACRRNSDQVVARLIHEAMRSAHPGRHPAGLPADERDAACGLPAEKDAAQKSGTCTNCGERVLLTDWQEHRERVHGTRAMPPGGGGDA